MGSGLFGIEFIGESDSNPDEAAEACRDADEGLFCCPLPKGNTTGGKFGPRIKPFCPGTKGRGSEAFGRECTIPRGKCCPSRKLGSNRGSAESLIYAHDDNDKEDDADAGPTSR